MIAVIVALLLLIAGAGEMTYGVFLLFGNGWGFVALGLFTIGFGVIASRGVT